MLSTQKIASGSSSPAIDVERGPRRFRVNRGTMKLRDVTHRPLAYRDEEFFDSEDARPLRILAEYLQPLQTFRCERVC